MHVASAELVVTAGHVTWTVLQCADAVMVSKHQNQRVAVISMSSAVNAGCEGGAMAAVGLWSTIMFVQIVQRGAGIFMFQFAGATDAPATRITTDHTRQGNENIMLITYNDVNSAAHQNRTCSFRGPDPEGLATVLPQHPHLVS